MILAYGLGALISPVAFGTAMEIVPPDGLLWLASAAATAYVALAAVRIRRAGPPPRHKIPHIDAAGDLQRPERSR